MENFYRPDQELICIGQPSEAEAIELLTQYSPTLWINLRPEDESGQIPGCEELARQHGAAFLRLPIRGGGIDITIEQATKLKILIDGASGSPIIIQCGSSNRVGALLALVKSKFDGFDLKRAIAYGEAAGMTKDTLVEKVRSEIKRLRHE